MKAHHCSRKSLTFEALEAKQLMAGDVAIGADGGNLFLMGDDADNQIAITNAQLPGAIAVVGLADTTVTLGGQTHAPGTPAVISGFRGNFVAHLNAGNDLVRIDGLAVRGRATILTGPGDDTVAVSQLIARRGLHVNAGVGDDSIVVDGVRTPRHVSLAGGPGSDNIVVQNTVARRGLAVQAGHGIGDGDDQVVVHQSRSSRARISTGLGDDVVRITDAALGHLAVNLGAGDDDLALGGIAVPGRAFLNGGLGEDTLTELASNHIRPGQVVNFA
ncbi:MAG: hypothetical protein ACR2NM_01795 [Bythopirellula sp.]